MTLTQCNYSENRQQHENNNVTLSMQNLYAREKTIAVFKNLDHVKILETSSFFTFFGGMLGEFFIGISLMKRLR